MEKQSRTQPYEDLTEMLKILQRKEKIQERMVKKFQKLIRNKGWDSSFIKDFPYPMAVFEQDGELVYINSVLSDQTGLSDPMILFMSNRTDKKTSSSEYREAIFFPITGDGDQTTQGAVIFMK